MTMQVGEVARIQVCSAWVSHVSKLMSASLFLVCFSVYVSASLF